MIPDTVNILGLDYRVLEVAVVDRNDPADGEFDPHEQTIRIDSSLSEQAKEQVLMHEILHGVFLQLGFDEHYEDEHLVQSVSAVLHQTLHPFTSSFLESAKERCPQQS